MKQETVNQNEIIMTEDYCYLHKEKSFTGVGRTYIEGKPIKETPYLNGS